MTTAHGWLGAAHQLPNVHSSHSLATTAVLEAACHCRADTPWQHSLAYEACQKSTHQLVCSQAAYQGRVYHPQQRVSSQGQSCGQGKG